MLLAALLIGVSAAAARSGAAPLGLNAGAGSAFGGGFTYQGQLKNAGGLVNATCDLRFGLWDAASAGSQLGADQTVGGVAVKDGLFIVTLDGAGEFGASAFDGGARWLEIAVKCAGDAGFATLAPRQALTAAPYALVSGSANALRGQPISPAAPAAGQALVWDGSQWAPQVAGVPSGVMIMTASQTPPAGYIYTGHMFVPNWVFKAPMSTQHYAGAAAVANGRIYAIGGWDAEGQISSIVEAHDPAKDKWTLITPMNDARYGLAAAAVDGTIYAITSTRLPRRTRPTSRGTRAAACSSASALPGTSTAWRRARASPSRRASCRR
ncbi:MAG TPA: kelch repeat-containing protein, partial [Roseiflexaceae bacterium]